MDEQKAAAVFKALGDEHRIHILKLLRSGERCACELLDELNISQPTLSHHMKILCDAGIVTGRKEGKWMHYSICGDSVRELRAQLQTLLTHSHSRTECCREKKI